MYEQVGQFKVSQTFRSAGTQKRTFLSKQGGNVVSYFCTPDLRVIHFRVGVVYAAELANEARWAAAAYHTMLRDPFDESGPAGHLRRGHHEQVAAETWEKYQAAGDAGPSSDKAGERVASVLATLKQMQAAHLPAGHPHLKWVKQRRVSIAGAEHILMATSPLPKLREIEAPVFEIMAGEPYLPRSERSDELADLAKQAIAAKQPLLIVIRGDIESAELLGIEDAATTLQANSSVRKQLAEFRVLQMTANELTWLLADIDQQPIKSRWNDSVRYVVFNGHGELVASLMQRHTLSVLNRMLKRAIEQSNAPAVAKAATELIPPSVRRTAATGAFD